MVAAITAWGIPDASKLNRLAGITQPTFVANGDNDTMMHTKNSRLLAEHLTRSFVARQAQVECLGLDNYHGSLLHRSLSWHARPIDEMFGETYSEPGVGGRGYTVPVQALAP